MTSIKIKLFLNTLDKYINIYYKDNMKITITNEIYI